MHKILNEVYIISTRHKNALIVTGLSMAVWFFVFHEAIFSAAKVWWTSEIYSHGFFILPIAGYLVWRKRYDVSEENPQPTYLAIIPILIFSFLYILGVAGNISLFQHTAIFSILPLSIWLIFGTSIVKKILFPLTFILFAIPFGEEFIPLLQRITADNSVWLLRIFDIPVYRNGLYIEIPNGRFVVAEACSGVRFFVGAAVFGAIFAYVSYTSKIKQSIFFISSLIIPIIANSIRVSIIILIGYYSDMKYATGVDHLVYGWVFFAIVILLLIVVGNIYADKNHQNIEKKIDYNKDERQLTFSIFIPFFFISGLYLIISVWTYLIHDIVQNNALLIKNTIDFVKENNEKQWIPKFEGASQIITKNYSVQNHKEIDYYSAHYPYNTPKTELISSKNRLYDPDDWTLKSARNISIEIEKGKKNKASLYSLVGSNQQNRFILYWYEIGEIKTSNKVLVKILQSVDVLFAKPGSGRIVIYTIKYTEDDMKKSKNQLIEFALHNYNQDF